MDFCDTVAAADGQVLLIRRQADAGHYVGNGRTIEVIGDVIVDKTHLAQAVLIVVLEHIAQILIVTGNTPRWVLSLLVHMLRMGP